MNTATHCNNCNVKLEDNNRYNISPFGGICRSKAWCADCYELLQKTQTRENMRFSAMPPNKEEEDEELFPRKWRL